MNPFPTLRRLLPRLQRYLLALSDDTLRFVALLLLWALAMVASLLVDPVNALQGRQQAPGLPAQTAPAPAPRAG